MSQDTASTVTVGSEEKNHPGDSWKKSLAKFCGLVVGLLVVIALTLFIHGKLTNHAITIGGTKITPKEVTELTDEMTQYAKRDKHVSFGNSPHKTARDYLVLNAALKDQAGKHHVTVSQEDIDAQLAQNYQSYGGQQKYEQFTQIEGITTLSRVQAENAAYKAKLENVVLAKKDLFVAGIIYDTPYVNSSTNPTPEQLRQQALQTVQNKFLPLFKEGKSIDYIASQADISPGRPAVNATNTSVGTYFTSMPSVAFYPKGCTTANPCFHDIKPKTPITGLPAAVSTQSVVDKLNTVGQNSGVINSEAGFVGIIELTGKTGGSYGSWGQFLTSYEKKYADGKLATTVTPTSGHIGSIIGAAVVPLRAIGRLTGSIGSVLFPKVAAAADGACTAESGHTDGSDHDIQINVQATDQNGNNLQGVNVVESRPHAQCANRNGQFIGDDDGTRNNGNTNSSGQLTFYDNCYNSAPDFSQTGPSGYQLGSVSVQDGMGDSSTMIVGNTFNGTPITADNAIDRAVSDSGIWTNGILNIAGQLNIQLHYNKPPPPPPTGNVSAGRCVNNIQVAGVSDGDGSGGHFYVQLTSSGGATPNGFPSNNSPSGGTYNTSSTTISVPDWVKSRTGSSDVGVQLWVQSAATGQYVNVDNANIAEPWAAGCPPPTHNPPGGCTGDNCPTCPSLGTDPVAINLVNHRGSVPGPLASDGTPGNGKPYGTTTQTDGSPAIRNTAGDERFNIQSVTANDIRGNDIGTWPSGISMNSPNQHWSPQLSGAPQTWTNPPSPWDAFSINYAPLIGNFPYDSTTPIAHYTEWYGQYHYAATGAQSGNYYAFQYTGEDWHVLDGSNFSQTLPTLQECYNRGFNVNTPTANATLQGHTDQPSSATFGFSGTVDFSLPNGDAPLLTPMQVCGLSYSASYYITNDASGGRTPLPSHSGDSGTLPCISSSGGTGPSGSGSYNFNTGPYGVPNMQAGDEVCVDFSVTPSGSQMDENGTITAASGSANTSSDCSAPVLNEPYFKVYNSGISAGGDFTCNGSGGLLEGWNDNTSADRGSSAQLSALALIKSTGVASAQTSAGRGPTDLTFANAGVSVTPDGESPDLGGAFGGNACLTNVSQPTNAQAESNNSPTVGSTWTNGSHSYSSGDVTLGTGNVASGTNPSVFVNNHDVYIRDTGNHGIKYSAGPWTITTTSTNVPSFTLVVTGGNIYIDPNITELDGLYVAKKDSGGHGGTIYTCGNPSGSFSPPPATSLYGTCNQQLTVYGSFVADQINLMRTYGSLRNSVAGEQPNGGGHTCDFSGGSNSNAVCAGEVFQFSPEMYLSNQSITPPGGGSLVESARSSLPPVL